MNVLTPKEKDYTIKNSDNEKLDGRLKNTLKNASKKVLNFSKLPFIWVSLKRNSDEFLFYFTI